MIGWKVFAALNAALVVSTIVGLRSGSYDGPFDLLSIALSIPAAIGLGLYAFGKRWLTPAFWRAIAWLYAAYSLVAIGIFLNRIVGTIAAKGFQPVGMLGAIAFIGCLQYFTWLALHRISQPRQALAT